MTARAFIPQIPDDGKVHPTVRDSLNKIRGIVNAFVRRASFARDTGNYNWKLGLTVADLPAAVIVQSELDAAIALLGHPIFDHYANGLSSHTDGTEDDLYSDTVTAGRLSANGQEIEAEYGGYCVGHATATRKLKLYFAGTAILDTGAILITAGDNRPWRLTTSIIRVSSSIVRHTSCLAIEGAPQSNYITVGELTGLTLANTAVLKITGAATAAGAAAADIAAIRGKVFWQPVAS